MSNLVDFADVGPIPEPTIWTKPPLDLAALEAKIIGLTPQWPLPGPAEKAMRELIEEVRELRAVSTQPRQWGPWIPWAGGECPIPDAKAGEYQLRFSHSTRIDDNPIGLPKQYAWKMNAAGCVITAYRVLAPADDLLRQAIEALTNSCNLLENYIDTFGDMSGANHADLNDYRAVIAAYDKRGK